VRRSHRCRAEAESLLKRLISMKHGSALSDVKVFNGKPTELEVRPRRQRSKPGYFFHALSSLCFSKNVESWKNNPSPNATAHNSGHPTLAHDDRPGAYY
jgi:hypothetical protein